MIKSTSLKVFITGISCLCMLLGLFVLIGWHTDNMRLIQVLPIFVPMQYNTALGFLLAGVGLSAAFKDKEVLGRIIFSIVGAIGFLTLAEYLIEINLGIDELFMKHHITVETSHPGRMAPNTALCFFLTAVSMMLSLSNNDRKIQISGVLGSLIFGLGLVAFVGYLIDMEMTYGWGRYTKMAVHTAFGFMTLGTGITILSIDKEISRSAYGKTNNEFWLAGYALSAILIIFFIDLSLPLGAAAGTLYVATMLFPWFIKRPYTSYILALLSTVFTVLGYLYSVGNQVEWMVISNRAFSILVVWTAAHLLYMVKKKERDLLVSNKELDQHILQLSQKNKELAQFTYIASHDLQEPLRTVTNFTRLFDEQYKEQLDEQAHSYLHFISQASNRMSNLIKGLLDYGRIGHNKQRSSVNLHKILEDLQIDLFTTIEETEATFQIGSLPRVRGFKVELGLLFQNLVLNAIKFRKPEVKPEIKISAREKANYYEISVQDNGIGIAPEHQEKIFSIFQRLHSKKEYEGTGIGLAHCQKIVELHQGTIKVSSIPSQGSSFIFTIKKK